MDSNRLVRLRAAEALMELDTPMAPLFEKVVETGDRYGLHAYLTALENADLRAKLEQELQGSTEIKEEVRDRLQKVLRTGTLQTGEPAVSESSPDKAALLP